MGTEIIIAAVCTAFAASGAGTALFGMAGRELLQDTQQPELKKKDQGQKKWQAGMYIGNIAAAVLLLSVYDAGLLTVFKMLFLCTVLWVCAWTDCKEYLILNRVLFVGLLVFLAVSALQALISPDKIHYTVMGAGMAAAGLFAAGWLCRLVIPGSVGFGDLKLLFLFGLYLGMEDAWNAIFYALFASFAVAVWLLATKRASKKSVLPFAPFLLIGTLSALCFYGK